MTTQLTFISSLDAARLSTIVQSVTQTLWDEGDQEARGVWVRDWLSYQQCDIYVWLQHILVIHR